MAKSSKSAGASGKRAVEALKPFTIKVGRGRGSLVTIQPPVVAPKPARARQIDRAVEQYFANRAKQDG